MRIVIWSRDALDDLGDTLDYLSAIDEDRALSIVDGLEAAGDKLGRYPTGRPGRVNGTLEKSVPKLRYIIAYAVDRNSSGPITILRVIHSARNWPKGTWPK